MRDEGALVGPHVLHAHVLEEAQGRGERHGARDVGRAALVAVGRSLEEGLVLRHVDDRASGRDVGRRLVEQLHRAVEKGRAEGRVGLVAGAGQEVDVARIVLRQHPDRGVGELLRRIDQDAGAVRVRQARDAVDVGQVARDVRGAGDRDQLDAVRPELPLEVLVVERAVLAHAEVDDLAAGAVREVVRVVLHQRDERDPVLPGHDVGGEIERLRRVPEQDQGRAVGLRPDEAQDVVGDVLEAVGRQLREMVLAPVDVGVRVLEEVLVGLEHGPRRVRARAVVQVDELLRLRRAEHLEALLGDRKLAADPLDVEHERAPAGGAYQIGICVRFSLIGEGGQRIEKPGRFTVALGGKQTGLGLAHPGYDHPMKRWLVGGLVLFATLAGGCVVWPEGTGPSAAPMPLDEALARRDRGEAVIIDVRSARFFAEGHIPGAISIPAAEIPSRIAEIRRLGKLPILYCG